MTRFQFSARTGLSGPPFWGGPEQNLPGGTSAVVPPDPMPNSEVKRRSADGSVGSPHARVGNCQASNQKGPARKRGALSHGKNKALSGLPGRRPAAAGGGFTRRSDPGPRARTRPYPQTHSDIYNFPSPEACERFQVPYCTHYTPGSEALHSSAISFTGWF